MLHADASTAMPLSAHIEQDHITVEFVTLSCSNQCADVQAVAKGGHTPYSYTWENGSTNPARHVCPSSSTSYDVTVTDTASSSGELRRPSSTVTAPLAANVVKCGDAGTTTDAGPPPSWLHCIVNPSFEGVVTPTQFQAFEASPWNACYAGGFITYSAIGDATLWPTQNWTFPPASEGATYLALGQQALFVGRTSQTLCAPVEAGAARSFLVDLARATSNAPTLEATTQVMQVLGGTSECAETDVLWTSPPLTVAWATYCVTIRPQQPITTLGFRPSGTGGAQMEGLVDHIVPVAGCP